jgi:hypothetical protein
MRFRGGLLAIAGLAFVVVLPARDAARPLTLNGPNRQTKGAVALFSRDGVTRLTHVDEQSLRPVGRRSARLGLTGPWAFAQPDGGLLAIATRPTDRDARDRIRFVDLSRLRLLKRTVPLDGMARALLWARLDRVVALVAGPCCSPGLDVVTIDTGARRVVSREAVAGDIVALSRAADALVLLVTPHNEIGSARLVIVTADGAVRSVGLDRVRAGYSWPEEGETPSAPIGTVREAALAVDPGGYQAFVIQPDGPAAEIGLRSLDVAYHELSSPRSVASRVAAWLTPAAEAKGLNGPMRYGQWLGDGLVAVTGTDETARLDANNQFAASGSPAGLAIVDTRDWTIRMLDRGADAVLPTEGLLLATGRSWSSLSNDPTGMGLAAYGSDRSLRFKLFAGRPAWVGVVSGGRAYVYLDGSETASVVHLASGEIIGKRKGPLPYPLLRDGPN